MLAPLRQRPLASGRYWSGRRPKSTFVGCAGDARFAQKSGQTSSGHKRRGIKGCSRIDNSSLRHSDRLRLRSALLGRLCDAIRCQSQHIGGRRPEGRAMCISCDHMRRDVVSRQCFRRGPSFDQDKSIFVADNGMKIVPEATRFGANNRRQIFIRDNLLAASSWKSLNRDNKHYLAFASWTAMIDFARDDFMPVSRVRNSLHYWLFRQWRRSAA